MSTCPTCERYRAAYRLLQNNSEPIHRMVSYMQGYVCIPEDIFDPVMESLLAPTTAERGETPLFGEV